MLERASHSPVPTVDPASSADPTGPAKALDPARDPAGFSREELETGAAVCPHAARHLALLKQETPPSPALLSELPTPPRPDISRLAQTLAFFRNPFEAVSRARAECGDLVVLDLLAPGPMVFVCNADLLHRLYQLPEDVLVAGEIRGKLFSDLVGKKVSIGLDGPEYRARRKITAPFLSGRQVKRWIPTIRRATEEAMASWRPGSEVRLQDVFDDISRRVICRVLFGDHEASGNDLLAKLSGQYLESFEWPAVQAPFLRFSWGPWSPWARFQRRYKKLYDAIDIEVRRRQEDPDHLDPTPGDTRDDMLQALLEAGFHDDPAEARDIVVQELIGMLIGGAETTSKALGWAFCGLLGNPAAVRALREELEGVLGDRPLGPDDLDHLPYLDAVVHESIRHQAVGPFAGPRMAKQAFELEGHRIEPGTVLVQAVHEVGRSPIFPNAEVFDPDHFYGRGIKQRDWVPFGGGMRKCTGMGLALAELGTIIATMVRGADLEMLPGSLAPVQAGIAYRAKSCLPVRVRPLR